MGKRKLKWGWQKYQYMITYWQIKTGWLLKGSRGCSETIHPKPHWHATWNSHRSNRRFRSAQASKSGRGRPPACPHKWPDGSDWECAPRPCANADNADSSKQSGFARVPSAIQQSGGAVFSSGLDGRVRSGQETAGEHTPIQTRQVKSGYLKQNTTRISLGNRKIAEFYFYIHHTLHPQHYQNYYPQKNLTFIVYLLYFWCVHEAQALFG